MLFKAAAFSSLAVFYGCYFSKMLDQRKKGIQTDQIGKGKTGRARNIELLLKAAAMLAPAVEVVSIALGTTRLPIWARAAGAAAAICGTVIFILSVLTMRDSWRAGVSAADRTALVTQGIYRFSRNPAFLGFDLVYAGVLCMFFNPILLAVSAFAAVMLHLQIVRVEEPFLIASFGEPYLKYMEKVNRYFGRKA